MSDAASDQERLAEIRRLFSEREQIMCTPRLLGGRRRAVAQECWVVRYARRGVRGAPSSYGIGSTPIEAAENALAHFQAEWRETLFAS